MVVQRVLLSAALLAVMVPVLGAQARWAEPYRRGKEAVNEGRYAEGIALLEKAIAIDRRQARVKIVEGVDSTEYFPFYYLGVAYLRTGDLDKAEDAFNDAKSCRCLTNELQGLLNKYEGDVKAARSKPKPTPPPPPPPGPDPNFTRRLNEADAALGQRRFADALQLFETLRQMDANEFNRRNLAARRNEAARAHADELVRQGDQLQKAGQLTAARAKYQEANTIVPGSGQRGLDEILSRQNQYAKFRGGAEADIKANRFEAALEKLKLAEGADPEQYQRDGLAARAQDLGQRLQGTTGGQKVRDLLRRAGERAAAHDYRTAVGLYGQALNADPNNAEAKSWLEANAQYEKQREAGTSLYKGGQLNEALEALENARRQNPERFTFEKLDELVKEIGDKLGSLPEEQAGPVRSALVAYLKGDAAAARTQLEAIAARADTLDPRVRAHVFAWLGVAYADLAITARAEAERAELRARALERFGQLLSTEPGYQFRDSLISPQIREIFNAARLKR
jgi:tetratricopeptide (TPR) repeat protein